jgi:hypothetical protein
MESIGDAVQKDEFLVAGVTIYFYLFLLNLQATPIYRHFQIQDIKISFNIK